MLTREVRRELCLADTPDPVHAAHRTAPPPSRALREPLKRPGAPDERRRRHRRNPPRFAEADIGIVITTLALTFSVYPSLDAR
jgi:hypothetical protein